MKRAYLDIYVPFGQPRALIVDLNDKPGHQAGYCLHSFAGHTAEREAVIRAAHTWAKNANFTIQEVTP